MAAALIIPASILGFFTAMVRMIAFNASLSEAAVSYLIVCAVAPAVILWFVKTGEMRRNARPTGALAAQ